MIFRFYMSLLLISLFLPNPLEAQFLSSDKWPERTISIVTSVPEMLAGNRKPNPESELLKALLPHLSEALGVPVVLIHEPRGYGVLGANKVASAKPDGYVLGAFDADAAMTRTAQIYTPYSFEEMVPVAIAWSPVYVLVVRAGTVKGDSLNDLTSLSPQKKLRLAYNGRSPISSAMLMALSASKDAGISWRLEEFDSIEPSLLFSGKVDAIVVPLSDVKDYVQAKILRVIAVFSDENISCGNFVSAKQIVKNNNMTPFFAFYVPAKVKFNIRQKIFNALNNALDDPEVRWIMKENCFEEFHANFDETISILNEQYSLIERKLERGGYISVPDIGSHRLVLGWDDK